MEYTHITPFRSSEEQVRAWAVEQAQSSFENRRPTDGEFRQRAGMIEDFVLNGVPKENSDLNDLAATDTFYVVMSELIGEQEDWIDTRSVEVGDFLIDCVDRLAKAGVRFKDGEVLEE